MILNMLKVVISDEVQLLLLYTSSCSFNQKMSMAAQAAKTVMRHVFQLETHSFNIYLEIYSGPSILRPPMGPRKYGLTLQVVLK